MTALTDNILELRDIQKTFGGTRALKSVTVTVRPGEVHAIVGENGAGKSTLMKILCGAYKPDQGTILLNGSPVQLASPHHAMNLGVATVHQTFTLVPELSVAENIYLSRLPRTRAGFIDWDTLYADAQALLTRMSLDLDVKAPVQTLGAAGKQITEIARALSLDAKILILDEPTAVLGASEVDRLFAIIRGLQAEGVTILYISHRLAEIFAIADRVTVLKDGQLVGVYDVDDQIDRDFLVSKMVGREWSDQFPQRVAPSHQERLRVEGLTRRPIFEDVSFTLHAGEILGLAGLVGSGRTKLCKALFGAAPYDHGTIFVDGQPATISSPREALDLGIAYLSEDRHNEGVILPLPIATNVTLPILSRFAPRHVLELGREVQFIDDMLERVDVRYRGRSQVLGTLSGGNQQKVALAKWLSTQATVFLLDEPTVGIDVGAKAEIYELITSLAAEGAACLLVSSDLPEMLSLSTRIVVIRKGRINGELDPRQATEEDVLRLAV
ncbi:MAG: sugar ABC transporter ATP-binding protein [Thermomicrobiales bacterium]|nr:sugar ABC transporter ATP-binding protein [Thermomicrobiales bacterium]